MKRKKRTFRIPVGQVWMGYSQPSLISVFDIHFVIAVYHRSPGEVIVKQGTVKEMEVWAKQITRKRPDPHL